jgi:hypothetical protein
MQLFRADEPLFAAQLNACCVLRACGRGRWGGMADSTPKARILRSTTKVVGKHKSRRARRALGGREAKEGRVHGDQAGLAFSTRISMAAAAEDAVSMELLSQQRGFVQERKWKREVVVVCGLLRGECWYKG